MNKEKRIIKLESIIITAFLFLVICVIISIIYLGETEATLLIKRIETGRAAEATECFDFANQYLKNKQFSDAIITFEKAITYDPDYYEVYINLAIAYAESGENQKAIQTLEKVLKKDPDKDYLVYLNMAQVYKRFDNEKAEQAYKTAIGIHPYLQDAYFSFGEFYWNIKKYDEAATNIKKGLEFQNLESYYTSAVKSGIKTYIEFPEVIANFKILLEQGTSDEIMQKYDSMVFNHYYLKNNPYIAEKYDQVGYYYLRKKEFNEASEYFKKSIQCWDSKKNRAYNHLETVDNNLNKTNSNKE